MKSHPRSSSSSRWFLLCGLSLLIAVSLPPAAWSQAATANLNGFVYDPSGAVVPGDLHVFSDYRHLEDDEEGTDVWALVHGFITITPLAIDQTHSADVDWLRQLDFTPFPLATH